MAGEPTLYHGDQSKDGWVEYLQHLLWENSPILGEASFGNTGVTVTEGLFDDATLAAVKKFQQVKHLHVDGKVGDQTWAALREEKTIPGPRDDGREPGTYVEEGVELRFDTFDMYHADQDRLVFRAVSVGTVPPPGPIKPFVHVRLPDGTFREPEVTHEVSTNGQLHIFEIEELTGGGLGSFGVLVQLPMDTGGDTSEFIIERG